MARSQAFRRRPASERAAVRDEALDLYRDGMGTCRIARVLGLLGGTIYRWVKVAGIARPRGRGCDTPSTSAARSRAQRQRHGLYRWRLRPDYGANIRAHRRRYGLSLKELARLLSSATGRKVQFWRLSLVERGERLPHADIVRVLAGWGVRP